MNGNFLVGARKVLRPTTFQAFDPVRREPMGPDFSIATAEDVADACRLADDAFDRFRESPLETRARFLEAVADRIDGLGASLIERAAKETGLPPARLSNERARTTGQLKMFAHIVREGRWAGVTIDIALPLREPVPRPDLRQRRIGVGPVAVFGASNFPLAFSVAGGDTASAWAAGCPVVVKGHPAHPGTSAMVGEAIAVAVADCDLPEGVFSLLQGPSNALGAVLVQDARIKSVGFTGSRSGGLALVSLAQARSEPIPVYAEMSSINPVILFPAALAERAEILAAEYVGSLTLGSGQFCTNPGVVLGIAGPDLERFTVAAATAIAGAQPQTMLTPGIQEGFDKGVAALSAHPAVRLVARGAQTTERGRGRAAIFTTTGAAFAADQVLAHEVFGAASIVVACANWAELTAVLTTMEGQLTATLQLSDADHGLARALLPLLERKVGRILANGWPTGVEVAPAMVHGGPFPATSDPRTTSVGAAAIERFLRPICYQSLPNSLLPDALKTENPLELPRFFTE